MTTNPNSAALHEDVPKNRVHLPNVLQRDRHLDRLEVCDTRIFNNLDNPLQSHGDHIGIFENLNILQYMRI